MERADIVLCVSRDTRAQVLDWAAIDPERALVLPNTLAGDFTPGDGAVVRGRLGVEGRKVLLSVSRLDTRQRHKGQDRVIAAIPELVARGLDVVYLIAGEGDDAPRLESLARQQGVTDRVRFLGRVPPKDLPDLYRAADLFVLPSTNEGFGIVYLEAMACGTPALGLAAGGAGDALGDGSLGTAVAEPDLAAAIDRILLSGPQDRTALAAATRARFGYDSFVDRVSQLLVL
jgi:phosphatidylinositol alpha-1,6-mannosyltransferase